jgi:hypothetical protein
MDGSARLVPGARMATILVMTGASIVGCSGTSRPTSSSSLSTFSLTPSTTGWLPRCRQITGLSIAPLPDGVRPSHTSKQARTVANTTVDGTITNIIAAAVVDPEDPKVGLPETRRTMWLVYRKRTYSLSPSGPFPNGPAIPNGTVFKTITAIDDKTLRLAGNFSC